MNIIKLKDVTMPEGLKISSFFNENLKGKYAYWIQMRYIFPFSSINYEDYVKYEQASEIEMTNKCIPKHIDLYGRDDCMFYFNNYIDTTETQRINSIDSFKIYNSYTPDYDITINDLKCFRTWLANQLLLLNTIVDENGNNTYSDLYTSDQTHMLEYYKNNMYNDIVKYLDKFGNSTISLNTVISTGCECCNSVNNLNTFNEINNCSDAGDIYRKNIKSFMVDTFSNINFWKDKNKTFLALFKKYIDNIITVGLVIPEATGSALNNNIYTTCNCNINNANFTKTLEKLSEALQYIIEDKIVGHQNFICDAFNDWSVNLYEKMYWK